MQTYLYKTTKNVFMLTDIDGDLCRLTKRAFLEAKVIGEFCRIVLSPEYKYRHSNLDAEVKVSDILKENGQSYSANELETVFDDLFLSDLISSETMFTQTDDRSVSNTITETSLLSTGIGSLVIPAHSFINGKTYKIKFIGKVSAQNGVQATIKFKLGAVEICSSTSSMPSTFSNVYYEVEFYFTCRSIGINGTVYGQGRSLVASGQGFATVTIRSLQMSSPVTINTEIDNLIDCTYKWGTASASNSITVTNCIIEILN